MERQQAYNETNSLSVYPNKNLCIFEFYKRESNFVFGKNVCNLPPNLPYKTLSLLKMVTLRLIESVV